MIEVQQVNKEFSVKVSKGEGTTYHKVKLSSDTFKKYGKGRSKEEFVKDCFKFLLKREPKERIMREFDISIINNFFPDFEKQI